MINNPFFYFNTLFLLKEKKRYFAIFLISTLLIFLLSSTLFISSSIKYSLNKGLKHQPDFVIQKLQGGNVSPIDNNFYKKITKIFGVSSVNRRVYGRYFVDSQKSVLIIGVDFFDQQSNKNLKKLIDSLNLKKFFSQKNMIVGSAVDNYLKTHFYNNSFAFLTPKGKILNVNVFKVLPKSSALFSNDVVIVPIELAKEILGYKPTQFTDIVLNVPNDSEWDNIKSKIEALKMDVRVVTKKDMKKFYENLFNYKGGYFLILFLITIVTFSLLLYLRYSLATSVEKKEVAILRAVGWSIKDVIKLKFFENISLVLFAFLLGVGLSYIYVFIFQAPILKNIFLSSNNLKNFATFVPVIDFSVLATVFIIFSVTFISSVLLPIWKIAISDVKKVL